MTDLLCANTNDYYQSKPKGWSKNQTPTGSTRTSPKGEGTLLFPYAMFF
jgi:hypothetical protein